MHLKWLDYFTFCAYNIFHTLRSLGILWSKSNKTWGSHLFFGCCCILALKLWPNTSILSVITRNITALRIIIFPHDMFYYRIALLQLSPINFNANDIETFVVNCIKSIVIICFSIRLEKPQLYSSAKNTSDNRQFHELEWSKITIDVNIFT